MRIGTGLPNQIRNVRPEVIPGWARQAEEAGFSSLSTVGRYSYPSVSDTVALAAAAGTTSRIELVSGVMLGLTWPAALLAKELAGIDGVSGGRLTVGLGLGGRADDFVAEGYGPRGLGARFDRDLETYREVWQGKPVGESPNPAVPPTTRQIPMLFGGFAAAALDRMACWGQGYIGPSMAASAVAPIFAAARAAWQKAGRDGSPRLVALVYYALSDGEAGRRNIYDYYSISGEEIATASAGVVCTSPAMVTDAMSAFADIGADDIIFNPGTDNVDDLKRLADIVL
jgi:alkanesulfonate monooxygenase SsuD/methylene tetrahydromethanopterin reductase-like flavin-dependent oxidoreductase (luciferase family)